MLGNIKKSSAVLYLKAHLLKSTESAVTLAEKKRTPGSIGFAENLLKVKNSSDEIYLNSQVMYEGSEITKMEKYGKLGGRVQALLPHLAEKVDCSETSAEDQFSKLNALSENSKIQRTNALPYARYTNVNTACATQLSTVDGKRMPANQLSVNNNKIAMRCQYPKDQFLQEHFSMLLKNKPAVVVVLSSSNDIGKIINNNHEGVKLPYFCRGGEDNLYGNISVKCRVKTDKKDNHKVVTTKLGELTLNNYRMEIKDKDTHNNLKLSVVHVTNWEDKTAVDADTLEQLALYTMNKVADKSKHDPRLDTQPLIHCNAGIGRTGTLSAALALLNTSNKSCLSDIVQQLRATGSSNMVQTKEQYQVLFELEKKLKMTPR